MTRTVRNDSGSRPAHRRPQHARRIVREAKPLPAPVTVIVPAYNEASSIADTILALRSQTLAPYEIIVVDDCSDDDTGEIAACFGATVIRPPTNTGSKAGAQTFALSHVITPFVIAIDADTTLDPRAIEHLYAIMDDPDVVAACGTVIPRRVRTVWERGRYVEYLFAFTFYKRIQDHYDAPLISSGCFSMYRTDVLRELGGWPNRTLAEDMDLTWTFHERGMKVRFVPEAVCYPIEPHDFHFMGQQLRRWSHGFVQNVRRHWRDILHVPFLRRAVAVAFWDAVVAAAMYLIALPVLAIALGNPWLLLGYIVDVPAVAIPVLVGAAERKEVKRALASLPAFFLLRTVNAVYFLRAVWSELVMSRSFTTYEKGH